MKWETRIIPKIKYLSYQCFTNQFFFFFSNFILKGNECYLNAAKCRDPTIKLAHDGPCGVRRNTIVCSTPWCWPTYEPVCGSDGITYGMYGHNTGKRPSLKS